MPPTDPVDADARNDRFDPPPDSPTEVRSVVRRPVDDVETARANRRWWDDEAGAYYLEHGGFLGDDDFVWGPEGLREEEAALLGDPAGARILEIGAGAGQCSRWLASRGAQVLVTDLSRGMLRQGQVLDSGRRPPGPATSEGGGLPYLQCDARQLPLADACVDVVFTSYGVLPFVADSAQVMREAERVLLPGGRFVFSTTHPVRWAMPDDPGEEGLRIAHSYFDRTPYVEQEDDDDLAGGVATTSRPPRATYVEHHRTLGDRVRELAGAGLVLVDLVEPEWPRDNRQTWGGWSPTRGRLIPGTAIFCARKPA